MGVFRCVQALLLLALWAVAAQAASSSAPDSPIAKTPTWQPPKVEDVRTQTLAWLDKTGVDRATRAKAAHLWAGLSGDAAGLELLDRLAQTFALADPRAAKLVALCAKPRSQVTLPSQAWLTDGKTPPLVANNLRLVYGRWLVLGAWFDEGLEQLAGLKTSDVVAPADLLFYQAIVHHQLLHKEEGLKAVEQLIDGAQYCPRRYLAVGYLIQSDLGALESDTLDHIARRMEDIQRRLDLGRAGPKVRGVEDGVIDSLDKMIKKIEEQEKQQAKNPGGSLQPSKPAQESRPMGGRGPGEVTKKNIGSKSGWGDMPPKDREDALQHIGQEFPSHCRDIVEQYFRRLATEEGTENHK